jgi:hypothetical protein
MLSCARSAKLRFGSSLPDLHGDGYGDGNGEDGTASYDELVEEERRQQQQRLLSLVQAAGNGK